jgi:hypothetical protein
LTREVRHTRRTTAKGRAGVAVAATEHAAARGVVVGAEYACASIRVGTKACRCGRIRHGLSVHIAWRIVESRAKGSLSEKGRFVLTTCGIIVAVRAEPTKPSAGLVTVVVVGAEAPKTTAEGHIVVYAAVARVYMLS